MALEACASGAVNTLSVGVTGRLHTEVSSRKKSINPSLFVTVAPKSGEGDAVEGGEINVGSLREAAAAMLRWCSGT